MSPSPLPAAASHSGGPEAPGAAEPPRPLPAISARRSPAPARAQRCHSRPATSPPRRGFGPCRLCLQGSGFLVRSRPHHELFRAWGSEAPPRPLP